MYHTKRETTYIIYIIYSSTFPREEIAPLPRALHSADIHAITEHRRPNIRIVRASIILRNGWITSTNVQTFIQRSARTSFPIGLLQIVLTDRNTLFQYMYNSSVCIWFTLLFCAKQKNGKHDSQFKEDISIVNQTKAIAWPTAYVYVLGSL